MNVDMDGVVLDTVSAVLGDVQSEVGGVDTMYVLSNSVSIAAGCCKRVL